MKHSRFTSLLLVITLMASVFAGAMGVLCSSASADIGSDYYALEWVNEMLAAHTDDTHYQQAYDLVNNYYGLSGYVVTVAVSKQSSSDVTVTVIKGTPRDSGDPIYTIASGASSIITTGYFCIHAHGAGLSAFRNFYYLSYSSVRIRPDYNLSYFNWSSNTQQLNCYSQYDDSRYVPCTNSFSSNSSYTIYFDKDIYDLNENLIAAANLVDVAPSTYSEYNLIDFYVGNRRYLSIDDQEVIRWVWRQENLTYFYVANYFDDQGTIADSFFWTDRDLVFIPNGDMYGDFYNVSNQGVYAVDITNLPVGFFYIDVSLVYESLSDEDSILIGYAGNVPFHLNLDKPQENYVNNYNSYVQYFQEYNDYYEEYLNNYVLPETDLPSYIKNLNHDPAASTACEIISTGSHAGEVMIVSEVFTWHPNTYLVCDSEMFWPGGGFNQYFEPEILNSVDVVLVVQHDDYMSLFEYTDQNNIKHYDTDFLANAIIFYHTENLNGIDKFSYWYVAQEDTGAVAPYDTVKAYCFFTSHYINHVQNMILADGITSVCDWLDEFSKNKESETAAVISGIGAMTMAVQTFNDSLNLWATQPDSFFFQLIDKLDAINLKLDSIGLTLERIANNTDEDQEPMWYESLWNWVRQFTPSENAFITGLNAIDDGFDNMPLLPVPSSYPNYPLLPTFTPTPSPDPGGG